MHPKRRARLDGSATYFTGESCCRGHVAPRITRSGLCSRCVEEDRKRAHPKGAQRLPTDLRVRLWRGARARARTFGVEFGIAVEDVPPIPEMCPILGIPIQERGLRANWPSLDRIDNSCGYVPNNLQVISYRANALKGNATVAEIQKLLAWMTARPTCAPQARCAVTPHHTYLPLRQRQLLRRLANGPEGIDGEHLSRGERNLATRMERDGLVEWRSQNATDYAEPEHAWDTLVITDKGLQAFLATQPRTSTFGRFPYA
jgi:hypothetical protein